MKTRLITTLLLVVIPGLVLFAQSDPKTISPEQADVLRTKAENLKPGLVSGNFNLVMVRCVELGDIVASSPKAAEMSATVEKMSKGPLPPELLAPSLTPSLLPLVDDLVYAINVGKTDDIKAVIRKITLALGGVAKEHYIQRAATRKPSSDVEWEKYFSLYQSLNSSLAANDITQSVIVANQFQQVLQERHANHKWLGHYGADLYTVYDALGRDAFARSDYRAAKDYLAKQAQIPSDQASSLCCHGPNLYLAQRLLGLGYHDEVLAFLVGVRSFWTKDNQDLEIWIAELQHGKTPNMAPNGSPAYGYRISN